MCLFSASFCNEYWCNEALSHQDAFGGVKKIVFVGEKVYLKLDNLQPSGSFKLRGIGNLALKAYGEGKRCLVSSSGGNGDGCGLCGLQVSEVVVVVPKTTPASARENIQTYGAESLFMGAYGMRLTNLLANFAIKTQK